MDSRDLKERIIAAVPIETYIGRFVSLKRSGRGFLGLCPFHKDSHPSFSVLPEPGTYRCFACGKSGDLFSFVMERDGLEFREAMDLLADYAGLERTSKKRSSADLRADKLVEVNEAALRHYREFLQSPAGSDVADYLKSRGVGLEVQERFSIGAAPREWQWLGAKIDRPKELKELGLVKEGKRGTFDFFRARLIFPIRNERGKTVGFGGRILPGDENPAKYINSSDSALFHKSKVLYGLHQAREGIREARECYVSEGYLDVIGLAQAGVRNVVAPLGTALSPDHLRLLRRYAGKVIFLYDGDNAGRAAALRGATAVIEDGEIEGSVVLLPPGQDPFDLAGQLTARQLLELLQQRVSASRFLTVETMFPGLALPKSATDGPAFAGAAASSYAEFSAEGLPIEEKRAARQRLLQLTKSISKQSDRDLFLAEGGRILKVDVTALRSEAGPMAVAGGGKQAAEQTQPGAPASGLRAGTGREVPQVPHDPAQVHREHQMLRWIISHPALVVPLVDEINQIDFVDAGAEALWRHLESRLLTGDLWTPETLASGELPGEMLALAMSVSERVEEDRAGGMPAATTAEVLRGILLTHRGQSLKREIARVDQRLRVADSVERDDLYEKYSELMREERRITDAIRSGGSTIGADSAKSGT